METLEYSHPSLFSLEEVPESPILQEGETGIRLNARGLYSDGQTLGFELLITYCFPRSYIRCFQRFSQSLSCILEDAATGQVATLPTVDVHKRYPPLQGPSFRGPYQPEAVPRSFKVGCLCIPFALPLAPSGQWGPRLFVTATLHEHVSNTLAFDCDLPRVHSFLGGVPHLPLSSEQGASPAPSLQRLVLKASRKETYRAGEPILLEAALRLLPEELEEFGTEQWVRSLFICATRQDNQASYARNWLGERLVFPDDVRRESVRGQDMAVIRASFDLSQAVGEQLEDGVYYAQVSARQYRSPILEFSCK
jgi:hypothetical protein